MNLKGNTTLRNQKLIFLSTVNKQQHQQSMQSHNKQIWIHHFSRLPTPVIMPACHVNC